MIQGAAYAAVAEKVGLKAKDVKAAVDGLLGVASDELKKNGSSKLEVESQIEDKEEAKKAYRNFAGKRDGGRGRQLQKSSSEVGVSDFGLDIPMLPHARRFPSGSEWQHHLLREDAEPDSFSLADWRGQRGHKSSLGGRVSNLGSDTPTPSHSRGFPAGSEWRHPPFRVPAVTNLLDDRAKGRVKPPSNQIYFIRHPRTFFHQVVVYKQDPRSYWHEFVGKEGEA